VAAERVAFMSYARFDDPHDDGEMALFRRLLVAEVRAQSGMDFGVFGDRDDIAWGASWQQRIDEALDDVSLLLVIITPGFFHSEACRAELARFLERERRLGRQDLILPVYYISAPEMEDPAVRASDEVARVLDSRQFFDWRQLRFESSSAPVVRRAVAQLANRMVNVWFAVQERRWDFFVSYVQADRLWAEWIAWQLEAGGFSVLIQAWDFAADSNWVAAMSRGLQESAQIIAVLSDAYLRSDHGAAEWRYALAADPSGVRASLLTVRVADCEPQGVLAGAARADLFAVPESMARTRLLDLAERRRLGRFKPLGPPDFPGNLARGPQDGGPGPAFPAEAVVRVWDAADVFQPTGVPEVTFVQPEWFVEFLMALRQPGLSIVLEGPSGVGKTTLLQHAIEQGPGRLGRPRTFTARDPSDVAAISELVAGGNHEGITAIDDFHRLPADLQIRVVDYLKLLADRSDRKRKVVIVGIPQTARSLVRVSFDMANRIRQFRLGWATDRQVLSLIEQGENALNIAFDDKPALVAAAGGSLITAQSLCWHLMGLARIEETLPVLATVPTDIGRARERVYRELRLKYHEAVTEFTSLGERSESAGIDLLLALASEADGVLYLDAYADRHPGGAVSPARSLDRQLGASIAGSETINRVIYYDQKGRRLIADDPQFGFYIRQLDRKELAREAGKHLPPRRHRLFLCYSHANTSWVERLLVHLGPLHKDGLVDVWSDKRIQPGADWRTEIDAALATARLAVLLVSADFYNSVFIRDVELPTLLESTDADGCKVIPLLVSASRFYTDPVLSRFQAAAGNGRTLAAMTQEDAEQVLADLATAIENEIAHLN
jgi:TIR domain